MVARVAFWFDAPIEYSGGLNYIRNLLYALSLVNDGSVRPYVFFSADLPANVEAQFAPYATIVKTKLLQRRTVPWFVHRVLYTMFASMALVNALLKQHRVDLLSHVWFVYKGKCPLPIIGWIPDFQYLHLPDLFPTLDPAEETMRNRRIIAQSDIVVVSSHNALQDFLQVAAPEHRQRARVLQFVSQPSEVASVPTTLGAIQKKYGFSGKFFCLPNQFWAHKNHLVVLQAVKLLKDQGIDVLVVCTGNVRDYRVKNTEYIDGIYAFIEANGLQNHVRILGHIDYSDVLFMMKNSLAVLNPSRFEGWSSSVEEAKSMGKTVVLSRIGVHVEQNPMNGHYFDPDDVPALARILAHVWSAPEGGAEAEGERIAREALRRRTNEFGLAYLHLVSGIARRAEASGATGRVEGAS